MLFLLNTDPSTVALLANTQSCIKTPQVNPDPLIRHLYTICKSRYHVTTATPQDLLSVTTLFRPPTPLLPPCAILHSCS